VILMPDDPEPTWRLLDALSDIEIRQISLDTYEMRSPTHHIMINQEGFDLFRSNDSAKWNRWLKDHNIVSVPRDDIES
jgi:hypothetical protein